MYTFLVFCLMELQNTKNKVYIIISNRVTVEPKMMYIHPLTRKSVALKNTSVSS
jgi:hypothetical protein